MSAGRRIEIRVSAADVGRWTAEAKRQGISLAAWIRLQCNYEPASQDDALIAPVVSALRGFLSAARKQRA